MAVPAIRIGGVTKAYERHVAVRNLSLTVPAGTVYGLLGPNGAGKTTTIRMILDIIRPDSGSIEVLGRRTGSEELTSRIGYLPEERGLYPKMQVRRVLRFLGALKGLDRREADRRMDEWTERLGLRNGGKDWTTARVEQLSRGMQQKVQFIAALLHEPELVILDEPFSGLDPVNAQAMKDTVVDLRRMGRTVIFSTHVMDNAERMCDSVCIIAGGSTVVDGPVSEVRGTGDDRHIALSLNSVPGNGVMQVLNDGSLVRRLDDQNRFFEIELSEGAHSAELLRRLVDAGADVERFEVVRPSLHQVFLERVGATNVEAGMSGHG
jgi:ABC-2 type transport system ATP-binding protein